MRTKSVVLLLLVNALVVTSRAEGAADPRAVLLGTWRGSSICTGARTACRDETVVYHITAGANAEMVTVAANKIVDGRELEMGTLEFNVDFKAHRMVSEFDNGNVASRWVFQWSSTELKGTAVLLPDGTKIRDIVLRR
ncbi:MAG: hypothetical protein ACJ74H_18000 [Thermoanaerobaculia bacterium]